MFIVHSECRAVGVFDFVVVASSVISVNTKAIGDFAVIFVAAIAVAVSVIAVYSSAFPLHAIIFWVLAGAVSVFA